MSDFDAAYERTMGAEGGYANDSHDRGGETWKGIARNFHPDLALWAIVDAARSEDTLDNPLVWRSMDDRLRDDAHLEQMVREFYREQFWNPVLGGAITDQGLANTLFDIAVNMGPKRANTFLQSALNMLNKGATLWADVAVDGQSGPATLAALRACETRGDLRLVAKLVSVQQGCHYVEQLQDPSQEGFARSWLARVVIM